MENEKHSGDPEWMATGRWKVTIVMETEDWK